MIGGAAYLESQRIDQSDPFIVVLSVILALVLFAIVVAIVREFRK